MNLAPFTYVVYPKFLYRLFKATRELQLNAQIKTDANTGPGFLDLPIEIRNEIYRELLISPCVSRRVSNPAYYSSAIESEPIGSPPPEDAEVGTLSILSVNRRIYQEASKVMGTENHWIIIQVNKAGFGKDMKDHGFGVIYSKLDCIAPALTVSVFYPSLISRDKVDTFLMANAGYSQLPRALWGKGMEEMVLHRDLHRGIAKNPVHEGMFLTCFYQLRGINEVILKGVRGEKHNTKMARELTMPYLDNNDILQDIGQAMFIYDQYIKDGDLQGAAEMLKCSIAVLADCFRCAGNKTVTDAQSKLKKTLDPDPNKALEAFKKLRVSVEQD
ncbi:hypothetical protein OEA41_000331 [Lepraria neglecta]|uniref:Uncharacterized protein n=1 Tax=Lepraria neglecta TaxID=209136 RepID=A0AAE0DRB1_9LECA|nr:hypothetical protein OEA41_000331 [Lepraria neglecta]